MSTPDEPPAGDLGLRLLNVAASPPQPDGSLQLLLHTTRGDIAGIVHPVEGGTGAAIFVGGALGGLEGPAEGLFARLPVALAASGVTSLRLHYRQPNHFEECVLDVLAGCSFLKAIGAAGVVLVGHSFGAAVVIKAGQVSDLVVGVASLSAQLYGTRQVDQLARPLLLVHGTADTVLDQRASEDIYQRARDPRQIVLFGETGHSLRRARRQLDPLLSSWIAGRLAGEPAPTGRLDLGPDPPAPTDAERPLDPTALTGC